MKRVRVFKGQKALVFRNRELITVLDKGAHWIGLGATVEMHDVNKMFGSAYNEKLLFQNESLLEHLHLLKIGDNELVLVYEDGRFSCVLEAGVYAFWKGFTTYEFTVCDMSETEVVAALDHTIFKREQMARYIRGFAVESHEKGLLYIDGKFERILEAGMYFFWRNGVSVAVKKADTRSLQVEISGQEILTKDKAAIRVNYEVQYQIVDIEKALALTENYQKQLYVFVQLALRGYIGSLTLDELLEKRDAIAGFVQSQLLEKADLLGLKITHSGMKDVILTGEMKDIMNRVLIAQKQAEANVIMRREETASTRSLLNTAKLMEENSMLFQLKEMEYIEKIADKINSISVSGGSQVAGQLKELFSSS